MENDHLYDIIIVGAGPAGCSLANFLSGDYKVLMIDWSKFPRNKPCGGLLVEETTDFLHELPIPKNVLSSPHTLDLELVDWDNDKVVSTKRGLVNVSRVSFDYWLLGLSDKSTGFSTQTKFLDFEDNKEHLSVMIEKNNKKSVLKTRFLVGADGAVSRVRNSINASRCRYYFAMQEFLLSDAFVGNKTAFIYDNEITDFYSWVIPKGNNLVIGSALQKNDVEKNFKLFKNKLNERMRISGPVAKRESTLISRPESMNDIVFGKGNVLLCGEAAGLISPSSGEGISYALRSGFNCARALNNSFDRPFNKYKDLCKPLAKDIEKKLEKSALLSNPDKRGDFLSKLEK